MPSAVRLPGSSADIPGLDAQLTAKADATDVTGLYIIPATTAGSMATVQAAAVRTANTTALNNAIVAAQAVGSTVKITSFCWADVGITTNGAACPIVGDGTHTGIGTIDETGILLDMRVTSGYAQAPSGFTLFGPNEYIPTNEYPGGTIPTTYTTVGLAVGRATGGTAQHLRLERMHILGFYDGVTMTNCTMALVTGNIMQHGRRSNLYLSHTYDSDSGDTSITDNWFHVANAGSPGYAAGTTVAMQVDGTSGLYVHSNKVYMRSDNGFNVNLANATYDIATSPAIKHIFTNNWFDSGGLVANSNCIKIRSAWGSGGTGTAITGNRISGVVVRDNVGHNCANLLDLSSYSGGITNIDIADNACFGGGGITLAGTIDRIRITGNTFDDGGWTGGYGPAKPVTSTATITEGRYYGNEWIGYGSAADLVDESATDTTDTSPATTVLTDGATVTVTCDPLRPVQSHRVVLEGNRTITWDVVGDDATLEGMRGELWVIQDATGLRTVTWTAPSGIAAIRWVGNSAPTLTTTANAYDMISWRVITATTGTYLMLTPHLNFGTVTPPTPGGIVEAFFTGTNGTVLAGTAPDSINTAGNNWADSATNAWQLNGSGAAKETTGGQARLTIDCADADVTIECDFILASTDFSLGGLVWNYVDANNFWKLRFRQSDSLCFVTKTVAGTATDYYGADYLGSNYIGVSAGALAAGTYNVKVVTAGDDLNWYVNDVELGNATLTSRSHKTSTIHGVLGSNGGNTNYTVDNFLILNA